MSTAPVTITLATETRGLESIAALRTTLDALAATVPPGTSAPGPTPRAS